jgi:putative PIN family toxin of toxin-antitoxin system
VKAVLDPNVLISALLAPGGAPAQLLSRWFAGQFELVVSERVLTELERALAYPKLRKRVDAAQAAGIVTLLRHSVLVREDPAEGPPRSRDPRDDYLLALAEAERAILVSGDRHLLELSDRFPVRTPRAFLDALDEGGV